MPTTQKLSSSSPMPSIGFGTWELTQEVTKEAVSTAIEAGYRLIDTAKIYDNEMQVGEAVRNSSVARQELFIITKLWNDDHGYQSTIAAHEASLQRLGLEYVDLYLIHWPATSRREDSWRALIDLQAQDKVRTIGVSNYAIRHLEELMSRSDIIPAVNQVEFHPFIYEQQKQLLEFCAQHNIAVQAYSPLSRFVDNPPAAIQKVANQVNKTPAQVVLRWCIQHGTVPLTRSQNPEHIIANFDVFNFELSDQAMTSLNMMSDGIRVTWDPAEIH